MEVSGKAVWLSLVAAFPEVRLRFRWMSKFPLQKLTPPGGFTLSLLDKYIRLEFSLLFAVHIAVHIGIFIAVQCSWIMLQIKKKGACWSTIVCHFYGNFFFFSLLGPVSTPSF